MHFCAQFSLLHLLPILNLLSKTSKFSSHPVCNHWNTKTITSDLWNQHSMFHVCKLAEAQPAYKTVCKKNNVEEGLIYMAVKQHTFVTNPYTSLT